VTDADLSDAELDQIEASLSHALGPLDEETARAAYRAVPGFRKTILQLMHEVRRRRAELTSSVHCRRCGRSVAPEDVRCAECCPGTA
jgi:hypothetical protein